MTTLEERLQSRLREWRKLARRYRIAQAECEKWSEEWYLNEENAVMIERLSAELVEDVAMHHATTPTPRGVSAIVEPIDDALPF